MPTRKLTSTWSGCGVREADDPLRVSAEEIPWEIRDDPRGAILSPRPATMAATSGAENASASSFAAARSVVAREEAHACEESVIEAQTITSREEPKGVPRRRICRDGLEGATIATVSPGRSAAGTSTKRARAQPARTVSFTWLRNDAHPRAVRGVLEARARETRDGSPRDERCGLLPSRCRDGPITVPEATP